MRGWDNVSKVLRIKLHAKCLQRCVDASDADEKFGNASLLNLLDGSTRARDRPVWLILGWCCCMSVQPFSIAS